MRVSVIQVRALIEAVEASGVSSSAFLRDAGMLEARVADPYAWCDISELDRLIHLAITHTGDQAFGLRWGERSPMMKYDIIPMLTAHAPTLRAGLVSLVRFQPILSERQEMELVEDATTATIKFLPLAVTPVALRARAEMGVSGLFRLMRYVGAHTAGAIVRIAFVHDAPPYVEAYRELFGGLVRFGQSFNGIELDRGWLDRPLSHCNSELHQVMVAQAEHVLSRVLRGLTHAEQLRSHLRSVFPKLPDMRDAARTLGMSERSLRRRLAEEGVSYSEILQESQSLLAQRLLVDHTRSIQEVAHEIGFASSTAFHRAFKRWTGESPAVYRELMMASGGHGQADAPAPLLPLAASDK